MEKPDYSFEESFDGWHCTYLCRRVEGFGKAPGKTGAKKKAAFVVLVHLMMSAGLSTEEMKGAMWETFE